MLACRNGPCECNFWFSWSVYKAFSLYRHPESLAVLRASLWPKSKGATFWGKNDNTTTSTGFKSHQLGKSHINPMAGRFGRKSHQRKKVTSICQNYNGTAAEGDRGWPSVHCQRQTGRPRLISSFYSYLGIATVLHSDTIVHYLANSIADIPRFGAKCPCPSGQNAPVQMAADITFKNKKMHK